MTPAPQQLDHVRAVLEAAGWVFAKTMPENPHWYTLRKTWTDDAAFVEVVEFIRQHGYREKFKGNRYTVMVIGGHKYWTMGWPVGATVLINRKLIETSSSFALPGVPTASGARAGRLAERKDHERDRSTSS